MAMGSQIEELTVYFENGQKSRGRGSYMPTRIHRARSRSLWSEKDSEPARHLEQDALAFLEFHLAQRRPLVVGNLEPRQVRDLEEQAGANQDGQDPAAALFCRLQELGQFRFLDEV